MLRLTNNPGTDTALKLAAVACVMFAFVFVVMVPLYDVMCDVLGINGKTSGSAYTAVPAQVDTSRQVTVQFIATNNDGMPWVFRPEVRQL
ncbi:MAG: cytochrome c oxidase assembly protein, partial [Luminiphilus sp.]